MKVNANRDISFKSVYTNKAVKKGLEFAADNGALFAATATVGFSALRPLSIWMTPKTEKENRLLAVSKSLSSSAVGFILTLGLSLPLSNSIKKIDEAPEKFLSGKTISKLKEPAKKLIESKGYILGTQIFKLGLGGIIAIPKAALVAAGMPFIMNSLGKDKNPHKKTDNMSFKGISPKEGLAKQIGSILNKEWYKNFIEKHKESNFPMHIVAATDIVATSAFIHQTKKSNKIKEERKNTLIYNSAISTFLSIFSGYILDVLLNKPTKNFINKYKELNKNDKNLAKQVQGIKIAKPIIILGTTYYCIIPFISTFLAEFTDKRKSTYS